MDALQCSCEYEADGISDLARHLLTCAERTDEDIAMLRKAEWATWLIFTKDQILDRLIRLETDNCDQAARIAELENALRRIAALENDSDTSDLVVLRKALRIAVDALDKKEDTMSKTFLYCETTEGGMHMQIVHSQKDLATLCGWMDKWCRLVDEALVSWMETAEVGDYYDHRLGVMVRVKDDPEASKEER